MLRRLCSSCYRSTLFHTTSNLFITIEKRVTVHELSSRPIHCLTTAFCTDCDAKAQKFHSQTEKAKNGSQWWIDYLKSLSFKERCINRLARYLECSEMEAKFLVDGDTITFLDKIESTLENIEFLLENGMSPYSIKTNIPVVRQPDLKIRMLHLNKWGIDKQYHSDFLPVFRLPYLDFLMVSNQFVKEKEESVPDGNRVIHFAKILGCSYMELNRRFVRCRVLYRHDFNQIESALKCYQAFGVETELILKDISALKYDQKLIKERLSVPFKKGLKPLKPALVSCTNLQYRRQLKNLEKQMNYYSPYKNREEYLNAKLFSGKKPISARKKRKLTSFFDLINSERLTGVMEWLLEKNYSIDQICTNLSVFYHDLPTLKERYAILQKAGVRSPTLKTFTKNQDAFEEFVKRIEYDKKERDHVYCDMSPLVLPHNTN